MQLDQKKRWRDERIYKSYTDWKRRIKLSLFMDEIIVYIKKFKKIQKN